MVSYTVHPQADGTLPHDEALFIACQTIMQRTPEARALTQACRARRYTCRSCKNPHMSYAAMDAGTVLCLACFDEAGIENEHSDGHHDDAPCEACKECQALAAE